MATTKENMESARQDWHRERAILEALKREFNDLCERMNAARITTDCYHQRYKDEKAIWRTGRAFNVDDPKQAAMLHRLNKPL